MFLTQEVTMVIHKEKFLTNTVEVRNTLLFSSMTFDTHFFFFKQSNIFNILEELLCVQ